MKDIKPITPEEAGITIESLNTHAEVRDGDWPCIAYDCRLLKDGKVFWAGPFYMGIGHVKDTEKQPWQTPTRCLSKPDQAERAAQLAMRQKVKPSVKDVMHSLLLDGSAAFDSIKFEDWCAEYGYSDDSIKAKDTYETCVQIGFTIEREFNEETLAGLREWASNY